MNIKTPCHGKPLNIILSYADTPAEPMELYCSADGCLNTWAPDGIADSWNKYPTGSK